MTSDRETLKQLAHFYSFIKKNLQKKLKEEDLEKIKELAKKVS